MRELQFKHVTACPQGTKATRTRRSRQTAQRCPVLFAVAVDAELDDDDDDDEEADDDEATAAGTRNLPCISLYSLSRRMVSTSSDT